MTTVIEEQPTGESRVTHRCWAIFVQEPCERIAFQVGFDYGSEASAVLDRDQWLVPKIGRRVCGYPSGTRIRIVCRETTETPVWDRKYFRKRT
jgi:hypothetical protein